jgi:hypothetical protein
VRLWEGAGSCEDPGCSGPGFAPFAPALSLTLSEGVGEKTVCWKLCDEAGNGAPAGTARVRLDTYVARPRPVLAAVVPGGYVALSRLAYPLSLSGSGIAFDTQAQVGDFTLPCLGADPEHDCRADADGGCGADGECEATCEADISAAGARNNPKREPPALAAGRSGHFRRPSMKKPEDKKQEDDCEPNR